MPVSDDSSGLFPTRLETRTKESNVRASRGVSSSGGSNVVVTRYDTKPVTKRRNESEFLYWNGEDGVTEFTFRN